MNIINSIDNPLVKTLLKLKQRKYRYEYGKFVLEGYRLIKDAICISNGDFVIIVKQSRYDDFCSEFDNIVVLSDKLFDRISETVNSQGIIAIAPLPEFKDKPDGEYCLYLDEVRDPGNLGTIIRTAAACGFRDIILNNCVDVYNPKTIRSSMSAYALCNFIESNENILDSGDYFIVCADAGGKDISDIGDKLKDKRVCLVIGNEARGLSEQVRRRADILLSLPMENGVESLNAAVSASVIMYYMKYFYRQ